jgi:alpha-beta hydrolase superfamily lysophospholipase
MTPAIAVPQGLETIAEGINPVVEYVCCDYHAPLYDWTNSKFSIVAVHGLNGHSEKTWTADNGINWLRDLLPEDLPNARIFSWGYDANTHGSSRVSCQYLYDHARSLVSDLCRVREKTKVQKSEDMHGRWLTDLSRQTIAQSSLSHTAWVESSSKVYGPTYYYLEPIH